MIITVYLDVTPWNLVDMYVQNEEIFCKMVHII
jgi:translation initiation factor 2B subunit (eIF-2B alpha/beta/delta family)